MQNKNNKIVEFFNSFDSKAEILDILETLKTDVETLIKDIKEKPPYLAENIILNAPIFEFLEDTAPDSRELKELIHLIED